MRHRVVAASLRDRPAGIDGFLRCFPVRRIRKDPVDREGAFMPEHVLRFHLRAIQESCGVERLRVEERELVHAGFLERGEGVGVRADRDRRDQMETGTGRVAVLPEHVVAARGGGERHVRKSASGQLLRRHPVIRVFREIIVAVPDDGVGGDEVVVRPVAIPVCRGHVVACDGGGEILRGVDDRFMRVEAVGRVSRAVRGV